MCITGMELSLLWCTNWIDSCELWIIWQRFVTIVYVVMLFRLNISFARNCSRNSLVDGNDDDEDDDGDDGGSDDYSNFDGNDDVMIFSNIKSMIPLSMNNDVISFMLHRARDLPGGLRDNLAVLQILNFVNP